MVRARKMRQHLQSWMLGGHCKRQTIYKPHPSLTTSNDGPTAPDFNRTGLSISTCSQVHHKKTLHSSVPLLSECPITSFCLYKDHTYFVLAVPTSIA